MSTWIWIASITFALVLVFLLYHVARNLSVLVQATQQQTGAIYELIKVQKARGRLERGDKQ